MAPEERGVHKVRKEARKQARKAIHPGLPSKRILDLVDVFLFLADARIPGTSVRLAGPFLTRSKRVYVLAKPDLADRGMTARWIASFADRGVPAFAVDCRTGDGMDNLIGYLRGRKEELDRGRPSGTNPRPLRLMLFGPPNVGKSSLANRLLGTQKAPFGAKPGLTRGSHWLRGRGFLEVLDTPGVVETAQVKGEARLKLAAVWGLPETAYDAGDLAVWLARRLMAPDVASDEGQETQAALSHLEDFGRQRGFLRLGGVVDLDRSCKAFIHAFREGQLGRVSLEEPAEIMAKDNTITREKGDTQDRGQALDGAPAAADNMATYLKELECPKCGKKFDPSHLHNMCECGTPLLVRYDLSKLAKDFSPAEWGKRPEGLWRYKELLPVIDDANRLSLGEGGTPVYGIPKLAKEYGLKELFIKDEGFNPTGTFKARGAAVGVSRAKELGVKTVAMPTAGNAGAAWAAYCSRAGIRMVVAMPEDAPATTQAECVAYGADTYLVKGIISDAGRVIKEAAAKNGWFEAATLKEPYRIEGKKTMGLEIWEQFKGRMPAAIIYPTGGGVGIIGMWKAFLELKELGWLTGPLPKMVVAQAEGCAPIVRAYKEGKDKAEFFQGAHTQAAGIRVPSALGDFLVLDAVRSSGGTCLTVTDDELLDTWKHLSKTEGALICPEGAAAVLAAKRIREEGLVSASDSVLVLNTGAGMKYTELLTEKAVNIGTDPIAK